MLHDKPNSAIWAAHNPFQWGKATDSSTNTSFRHNNLIYISASDSCFGAVNEKDFTTTNLDGTPMSGKKPSKEWPLHLALYEKSGDIGTVIHTHSTYSVLRTSVPGLSKYDCIPDYTPYLKIKPGTVGLVPCGRPGSGALFAAFRERVHENQGYLLRNHGPIVPDKTVIDAFYYLEKLEEGARVVWELYRAGLHHL